MNAEEIYDDLAAYYEDAFEGDEGLITAVHDAMRMCKPQSRILDVGCGTGRPTAELLANNGHDVTGIDVSSKMIEIARTQIKGNFIKADMSSYEPSTKFHAIFAVLSLFHLSSDGIRKMLSKMTSWLEDGGFIFIGTLALEDLNNPTIVSQPGYDLEAGIAEMVEVEAFQKLTRCTYLSKPRWLEFLRDAGLVIEFERTEPFTIDWGEGETWDEKHYYVAARRMKSPA